jgi:hypothetical protein
LMWPLVQLNNATMFGDLVAPPGNRLEVLRRPCWQAFDPNQRSMAGRVSME